MTASAIYVGSVIHRRLRPRRYRLKHAVFWTLFDLDELDTLDQKLWMFSRNRFNLVSFFDRDHGDTTSIPLKSQIERYLRESGISPVGISIRLLCMPRILGYAFNPLSIYFCYRQDHTLVAILYEVRNTFGERHSYLFPVTRPDHVIRQTCDKAFYVSPFMDMRMRYAFRVSPPGANVSVSITGSDEEGPLIVAALFGKLQSLNDARLAVLLARIPLLTFKVIGAIHWHALKMWLRGFRLTQKPLRPDTPVSIIHSGNE